MTFPPSPSMPGWRSPTQCGVLLDEAARACGSWPFARATALDRCRRDLEVFLLQHRLDPMLAGAGSTTLDGLAQ